MLFDTHAHLTDEAYDQDREQVINELMSIGMAGVINCGSDEQSSYACILLAERYDFMYAAAGIHPHDAKYFDQKFEDKLSEWLKLPKVVAVGEIGLDYYYDYSPRGIQKKVFAAQIEIAAKFNKPIIVHSREASLDTYELLKSEMRGARSGVLHSFSQSTEMLKKYLDLGMDISISGAVTFNNATKIRETVQYVPLDRLLIETDSPYLTPVPFRGKRNTPANVRYVAQKLAEIFQMDYEKICEITCENAKRVFNI